MPKTSDNNRSPKVITDEQEQSPSIPATWPKGMTWWGHYLPYQDDQGEYHFDENTFWTIGKSWQLKTWLTECRNVLGPYAYNAITEQRPYRTQRMHRDVVIREKIRLLREHGHPLTSEALKGLKINEKCQEVCNEMRKRLSMRERALSVCSRTPSRLYRMGIRPWTATGEHFAHVITVNEEALRFYLDHGIVPDPPPEIHPNNIRIGDAHGSGKRAVSTTHNHDKFNRAPSADEDVFH